MQESICYLVTVMSQCPLQGPRSDSHLAVTRLLRDHFTQPWETQWGALFRSFRHEIGTSPSYLSVLLHSIHASHGTLHLHCLSVSYLSRKTVVCREIATYFWKTCLFSDHCLPNQNKQKVKYRLSIDVTPSEVSWCERKRDHHQQSWRNNHKYATK